MQWKHSAEEQCSVRFDGEYLYPGELGPASNPDMSLQDAILTRRTVRAYRPEPVAFELFERLVELAMHAPTACDEQRWKIIYLDDPKVFQDLYERGSAAALTKCRQAFLVCYNHFTDNLQYEDHVQSAAAFITTFSLVAHTVGVGTCWLGHLPNKGEVRRMFGIHRYFDPVALVAFGYYREKVKLRPRKRSPSQIIFRGRFETAGLEFSTSKNVRARRIARTLYYLVPPFLRRKLRRYSLKYEKKFYNEVYD
jgi:nitroreductase